MVVNSFGHTDKMRVSGVAPASTIAQFTNGVAVEIVETDNVLKRVPHLVGCIGVVYEVPAHPNTWFQIKFSDGNTTPQLSLLYVFQCVLTRVQ